MAGRRTPASYRSGFARRGYQSAYPSLWRGCTGAWCPELGMTGSSIKDWSGKNQHGVLNGTVTNAWSRINGALALYLNSVTTYVDITMAADPTFSLSFWVYYDAASYAFPYTQGRILSNTADATTPISVKNSGCDVWDGSFVRALAFTSSMAVRTWSHIAVTWRSGAQAAYLNGVPNGTNTLSQTSVAGTTLRLGSNNASQSFIGYLGDVRFWNRILSQTEVSWLYSRRAVAHELRSEYLTDPAFARSIYGSYYYRQLMGAEYV